MTQDYYSEITSQLHQIREHKQDIVEEHRKMALELVDQHLQEVVDNLSILSLHILSALEEKPLTGMELSKILNSTRGGITRAAKKLLEYQLITASQPTNDRKKIYYQLTEQGLTLATAHDQMHQKLESDFRKQILNDLSLVDQRVIANFLDSFINFKPKN